MKKILGLLLIITFMVLGVAFVNPDKAEAYYGGYTYSYRGNGYTNYYGSNSGYSVYDRGNGYSDISYGSGYTSRRYDNGFGTVRYEHYSDFQTLVFDPAPGKTGAEMRD